MIPVGLIEGRTIIRCFTEVRTARGGSSYVIAGWLTVLWTGIWAIYLH